MDSRLEFIDRFGYTRRQDLMSGWSHQHIILNPNPNASPALIDFGLSFNWLNVG